MSVALMDSLLAEQRRCEQRRYPRKLDECPASARCRRCARGRELRAAINRGERGE